MRTVSLILQESPIYNSYYQWVSIYLFGIAVLFYAPRGLWIMMEGGLMKHFCKGTSTKMVEEYDEKIDKLLKVWNFYYLSAKTLPLTCIIHRCWPCNSGDPDFGVRCLRSLDHCLIAFFKCWYSWWSTSFWPPSMVYISRCLIAK